ncbi:MAG: sigma 54-interacting transcriptional regulator [Flavobacteriales bacterium]
MTIQQIKQRYSIIGNSPELDRALEIATVVAPTDLSVLITGESGSGKEVMGKIVHENSARKHGPYIAVNCGAIPEGTIDSELFGHEKGSFTGAHEARKGYFEVADKGTIFLDEVGELPLSTQVRLLRVLETGEFIRVGSSKSQRTSVRVVAATNVNMWQAVQKGTFRDDLYYRLNAIPIFLPPLRERGADIGLLFRKFAVDGAERHRMKEPITLTPDALQLLTAYRWPGNVRQLRNIVEQINVIEVEDRLVDATKLRRYLPQVDASLLPAVRSGEPVEQQGPNEREMLYAVIAKLQQDVNALKEHFALVQGDPQGPHSIAAAYRENVLLPAANNDHGGYTIERAPRADDEPHDVDHTEVEETLSLEEKEKELIKKALVKHRNKRKSAAQELGISERTLYRKIKEYDIP